MIVHHVGIICNKDAAQAIWDLLNIVTNVRSDHKYVPEFDCDCIMLGGIELVIPKGGKLLERLNQYGASIHHVAVKVQDARAASNKLRESGIKLVQEDPVVGVGDILVNFIHPSVYGIMIELVQEV